MKRPARHLDGVGDEVEDVGGTTFHAINSKLDALLDVMQPAEPAVMTSEQEAAEEAPAPVEAEDGQASAADDQKVKVKNRPRGKANKKSQRVEDAPPPAEEPVVVAEDPAETTDVGGALDFHPLVVGNADKSTFAVFELEDEPIHEEQVLDEQGPHHTVHEEQILDEQGPKHTVAPHLTAGQEEQILDEMAPPAPAAGGHGKDSGENDSAATIEEAEDEEEPVFESLRDYHSSLRRPSDDGQHVGHIHDKYSLEKNAQNPELLPERWIPPDDLELAPRAPGDEEDDAGKQECRSVGGAFGAKSGGVVIRYQYELRHLAGPSVDDIIPSLEGGITDRLLPIFFGEECREIKVNNLMSQAGYTERRLGVDREGGLIDGGLRGSGAGRALAEEVDAAPETGNLRGHRRLSKVIGIDSTPEDSPIFGKDCQFQIPNINTRCHVMEGALTLHFPPNYSVEQLVQGAHLSALNKLRESMADGSLAYSHESLMDLNFLPSSYTLRPIIDSAFTARLAEQGPGAASSKSVPVGAIVGAIIPLLLCCFCGCGVFACYKRNGSSFAVPGIEINVNSRKDLDDGSEADDELEKPRNKKDRKKKRRKKKRSGRSDSTVGSSTDNDESTLGSSLDEFDRLAEGMNAARAVGSDDESEALLDKSAKSKKKKKKKDKKKKKKKNNDDDTTDDDDTAERTTDESNEDSQEDSDRSLSSLEKFELLKKDRRSALNSSDPNMSRLRMSSSSIGRDVSTNMRAELARSRRASFAVNRGAPNPADLRRGGSTRSFHSDRRRSFHSNNDSFHSLGSSFASRGSRRTSDSDNMSTTSHTSTTSSDGSHTSTTSSDEEHTRETNGTSTSSSDDTSSNGSSSSSSDDEKGQLEKRVMSTFLHHRKGVKQQMRQGGKKKMVSKPNTRTKKNNNVMMGHVDTGEEDDDDVSCATEAISNKAGGFHRAPFGGGYQAKQTQDDDDDDNASVFSAMTEVTEAVSNRPGGGFRRAPFSGGYQAKQTQDDDDVSCATEAVSNKAGGFRRAPFGGYQAKQTQDDDDVSCATEAVSNKAGGFRRAPFGGYQAKQTQDDDDDDNASVFSAMTEVTEAVTNRAPVKRKPWRPSGYRGVGGGDGDNASVMSGTSAATEVVTNRKKPTPGGRSSSRSSSSSRDSDDGSVNSAASGRSARSGRSAATEAVTNKKKGGSFNASTLSNNSDDVSVMSEATEMASNTRKPRRQGSFRRGGSFHRQGSFHLQGISEGDSDDDS